MSHYLPRATLSPSDAAADDIQRAFDEASRMSPEQQKALSMIMALTIVYDSLRNPIHGWFFRRLLKSYGNEKQRWDTQLETRLAAFSVASRKLSGAH